MAQEWSEELSAALGSSPRALAGIQDPTSPNSNLEHSHSSLMSYSVSV